MILRDGKSRSVLQTDGQGLATVPREVVSLPVHVEASCTGYAPARLSVHEDPRTDTHQLRMARRFELVFTFVDEEGAPVPSVSVRLSPSGDGWAGKVRKTTSDGAGRARFSDFPFASGTTLTVLAAREGSAFFRRTWAFDDVLRAGCELRVELQDELRFRVSFSGVESWVETGLTADYVFPSLTPPGYKSDRVQVLSRSVPVGADGTIEFSGPRQGAVRLRLRAGNEVIHLCDLNARTHSVAKIAVSGARRITVQARGPDGNAIGEAGLVISRRDEGFSHVLLHGTTSPSGDFTFFGCRPGRYSGAVRVPGFLEKGFDFRVGSDYRQVLSVNLARDSGPQE